MTTLERIAYLRKYGIEAYRQIAEPDCFILRQAEWFEENDPSKMSVLWSLNYTCLRSMLENPPIIIDSFHAWQICKSILRTGKIKPSLLL